MEGYSKIATAYYEKATEKEKDFIKERFNELDINGDGKIALPELQKFFGSWLDTTQSQDVYKQLNKNSEGEMDFFQFLPAYYMTMKTGGKSTCNNCSTVLVGPHFSCLLCVEKYPKQYNLCCACYGKPKTQHEHDKSIYLLDSHALLNELQKRTVAAAEMNKKKVYPDMEGYTELAKAYYERATENEKNLVKAFFRELDKNGDGKVTLPEVKKLFGSWFKGVKTENIYNQLDKNSEGSLNFNQVLPLYYMKEKTGVMACYNCYAILLGPYFSCLLCIGIYPKSYNLCCTCYHGGKYSKHEHESKHLLDQYSMLNVLRERTANAEGSTPKLCSSVEGYNEIATAYYERATKKEKDLIKKSFKELDVNGDGKISLLEIKKYFGSWITADGAEGVYKKLEKNNEGELDFFQFLPIYYMRTKTGWMPCSGCYVPLLGPFFSCLLCVEKDSSSYNLCSACHRGGKSNHEHDLEHMLDHHSLISVFRKRAAATVEKSKRKIEMEELMVIAKAHYEAADPKIQKLAHNFFKSMDTDGNDAVDLEEFITFMKQEEQGNLQMRSKEFFKDLDIDGKGSLGFWDVMTVFYIIKSGRPFCGRCGNFIPGMYFSCIECYKSPKGSYDLCCDCYQSKKSKHNHNGLTSFLDNYTLLEATKSPAPANSSDAKVPPGRTTSAVDITFRALQVGISVASVASGCTIM